MIFWPKLYTCLDFTDFSINVLFSVPESNPGPHIVCGYCISLVFCDLDNLEEYWSIIFRLSLNLSSSGVSYDWIVFMYFLQECVFSYEYI